MLPDGVYDGVVIDVDTGPDGEIGLDLTIVAGAHKGEVVTVWASGLSDDPIELMGLPVTLSVSEGRPRVRVDR